MKGPFVIVYVDWFGMKHRRVVFAKTSEEAIKNFEKKFFNGTCVVKEILEVYLDIRLMLGRYEPNEFNEFDDFEKLFW